MVRIDPAPPHSLPDGGCPLSEAKIRRDSAQFRGASVPKRALSAAIAWHFPPGFSAALARSTVSAWGSFGEPTLPIQWEFGWDLCAATDGRRTRTPSKRAINLVHCHRWIGTRALWDGTRCVPLRATYRWAKSMLAGIRDLRGRGRIR